MEILGAFIVVILAIIVSAGDTYYRVYVRPDINDEDIERYENSSFWTRTRQRRSRYYSALRAKRIRERLGLQDTTNFEIPDWAKGDEGTSKKDAWKCPDCGRLNHGFQDTCACSYRKNV
ncbi:MAG: hypothetical protein K6F51_12130 [Acetatifactor sp.]|nr:hypothetical protein [Acetatifactor sp.]